MIERRPTIYVVDDDPDMLKSVTRLLRANCFEVVGFSCARDFLEYVPPEGDACLVLDIGLPDLDGLCLHEQVAARQGPPVVFITGDVDVPKCVRAMKAGAVDFLQKPFTEEDLLKAIMAALTRHHRERLQREEIAKIRALYEQLTAREREVMAHVVSGQLNKQIAADLGTAEKTVKVHRARVMEKMRVVSVADLVRQAGPIGIDVRQKSGLVPVLTSDKEER
jgi:FixJ family two-component response regulator